ncbi:TPA: phage tail protein, partial [Vibrio cholerae]
LRRSLYFAMVDPLVSEANIKRLQGKEAEAIELERQAIAAREKIQLENPWPVNPEA